MTKPGDPGHAAASRQATTGAVATGSLATGSLAAAGDEAQGADATGRRRPWTLRRRLLLIVAALLVAVSAVVGVVSVAVFHSSSVARLDENLEAALTRADLGIADQPRSFPGDPDDAPGVILNVPGQQAGTLAALVSSDGDMQAGYITERGRVLDLPPEHAQLLAAVPPDGHPHTIDAGELGDYRAQALSRPEWNGVTVVLALPLAQVEADSQQLALTITIVALAGLVIALGLGSIIVARALDPLERVTETAQRVSELPLDRGDVALAERVDVADDGTEVGRLGSAFDRMLGHVASALTAREESEQKVRRFVADASHELRTPLASIRGYAELTRLHGGTLPDDVVHALSRIESESLRMTELVEDLLLLARLDEGRELVHSRVDLRTIVVDAVGDAQAAGPDHEWSVEAPDAAVLVLGDDARLRQVLTNLLANARVHTPAGTEVTAKLRVRGDRALLEVVDDGPGIDESVRATMFERFVRGDASRSRRAGSTGLGLAIVRAVVEAHHGTVGVESRPGRTVFSVELPLAR